MKKIWDKGYALDATIESFTVGNDAELDSRLVSYDCLASIAHAKMLGKIGILKKSETQKLVRELHRIILLDKAGKFKIRRGQEDCHTAIEQHLTARLGEVGKKIHTARSRNDQVLTALRLYYKDQLIFCRTAINALIDGLSAFARKYGTVRFPGYTHTRKAMPSSVATWSRAFGDSMKDNLKLLDVVGQTIDQSPLGTGAGYGVPLAIDRRYTAKMLGFTHIQTNPIYTHNSRGKFESSILHVLSQIMLDINKMATDLIMFSMPEFGYFVLPKEFCTGSSIMPQKMNPDVLELLRAKYHVVLSYEITVKSLVGNLISGYHRDLQLTKEPVMKGFDSTQESVKVMTLVFSKLSVDQDRCRQAMTTDVFATADVYALVKKGVPFRDAYRQISRRFLKPT